MTNSKIDQILKIIEETPIFNSANENLLRDILKDYGEILSFSKYDTVFSKFNEKSICIIIKGEVKVSKCGTTISHLKKGDLYGGAFLYNSEYNFENIVTAITPLKVVVIKKEGMDKLLNSDVKVAINYIKYLSERIGFLNSKIEGYIKPTAEEKLLLYIKNNCKNENQCELTVSMTELSVILGISRASLYRVIDDLEESGKISRNGKKICLQNK